MTLSSYWLKNGLRTCQFDAIEMEGATTRMVWDFLLPIDYQILRVVSRNLLCVRWVIHCERLPVMTVKITFWVVRAVHDLFELCRYLILAHTRDIWVARSMSKVWLICLLSVILAIQSRVCFELLTRHLSRILLVWLALIGIHFMVLYLK